jgi:hypothetical protein
MKKITLTSILALCMACPAMANIDKDASSATCDNATIGTTTGPANLQADWTANTINLKWYNGENEIEIANNAAQKTCTYDRSITLPDTPTSPAGYTFGGWKVRIPTFDLSSLAQYINTNGSAYYAHGWAFNADYCFAYGDGTVGGSGAQVCTSEPGISDLALYEWKTVFAYGTIRGEVYCSGKSGNNHNKQWGGNSSDWIATESELTSADGDKKNCWCKLTGFDAKGDGTYSSVGASSWVFKGNISYDRGDATDCPRYCAKDCGSALKSYSAFREAMYGITQ